MDTCYDIEPAIDVQCVEYGTQLIDGILYCKIGNPIVLPAPTNNETPEVLLGMEIARRVALNATDAEKIWIHEVTKGSMPFASPQYKTDPHRGVKIPSAIDTDMKFEGTDFRNNDPLYDFYKKVGDGRQYLGWGRQGKHLIGGLNGLKGSFTSLSGVLDGNEMANQIKWEFNWKGLPVPDRVRLP